MLEYNARYPIPTFLLSLPSSTLPASSPIYTESPPSFNAIFPSIDTLPLTSKEPVNECKSSEVEQGADLRQPEVSVAMQEMRRRGWAEKRDLKKKGKGRPVHIYTLTKKLPDILNTFEQEKMKQVETIKKDLTDLQGMIKEYQ